MSIVDLQEIAADMWQAKYRGNYGVYKIKLKMKEGKAESFSCSCPSDYYPCKHIAMIREAVNERVAREKQKPKETTVEELLQGVSLKDLQAFVVKQAQYNKDLKKAILLAFSGNKKAGKRSDYNQIIADAFMDLYFDEDDLYHAQYEEDAIELDALTEWLDKVQEYIDEKDAPEAVLICKACIEEYASWLGDQGSEILDYLDSDYQGRMYKLLEQAATMQGVDRKELLRYCKTEMEKPQYQINDLCDIFNDIIMKLTDTDDADDFIALQDKQLKAVADKSSREAEKILTRKIDFYHSINEPEKAWRIMQENLQIETFRKELVQQMISENRLDEAKKLVNDYITEKKGGYLSPWYELKLQIAQKEKDVPTIRSVSFYYIQSHFEKKYYELYKSTFDQKEWPEELEKLLKHYERKGAGNRYHSWSSDSVADVLLIEKAAKRLMEHVEKYLSVDRLKKYYPGFAPSYPAETLRMFEKTINKHAENTGRDVYEYIKSLLVHMLDIPGGKEVVRKMIDNYKILYKNRPAMMEILRTVPI